MKLDGYFINLDRSGERRRSMETQLASLGCEERITRLSATDGAALGPFDNAARNGIWACRQSHERIILTSADDTATVILEDDVELSRAFPQVVNEGVLGQFIEQNPECDVLFLDCCPFWIQVPELLAQAEVWMPGRRPTGTSNDNRHAVSNVGLVEAKGTYAFCTAAYVVTPKGKRILRKLIASNTDDALPIDTLYRDWIASGVLEAKLTVPFLATPKFVNLSTIEYQDLESPVLHETEGLRINAVRRLLFAGDADFDVNEVQKLLLATEPSPEYALGMRLYEAMRVSG